MAFNPQSSERFAQHIEARVSATGMSYLDAINEYVEQRGLEPEQIPKLLNDKLKTAIRLEAQALHLIPKANSLPL